SAGLRRDRAHPLRGATSPLTAPRKRNDSRAPLLPTGRRVTGPYPCRRIGIARALYHDPEVLVMDEATSALDGARENAVMEAIRALAGKKTIILIAHRLTTVQQADAIWMLRDGRVEQAGSYDVLMQGNRSFREFAGAGG